jgi:hypothetical protein
MANDYYFQNAHRLSSIEFYLKNATEMYKMMISLVNAKSEKYRFCGSALQNKYVLIYDYLCNLETVNHYWVLIQR